jgi:hypothetical protein
MASKVEVDTIVNAGGDNDTGIDLATNDQILLKVANATKLTMNSTGQTTIVGEGGTTTTSVQQGLAKSWIQFNGSGTISTQDSFNRGGLTDNGTGDYTLTFTNNMNNNDFSATAETKTHTQMVEAVSTSTIQILTMNTGGTNIDDTIVCLTAHGDLA